jgi:hypothetical protein
MRIPIEVEPFICCTDAPTESEREDKDEIGGPDGLNSKEEDVTEFEEEEGGDDDEIGPCPDEGFCD